MNSAELKRAKRRIRAEVLSARDALSADARGRRSRQLSKRLVSLPELADVSTVMAFWSFGSEVDTDPLITALHERSLRLVLPRIVEGDLEVRAYVPGDPVSPTRFGAFEPVDGDVLDPAELDAVLTPGVAFDRNGGRIGYGGGFYDRFFRRTRPMTIRIGIGFDLQLVDDELPSGHLDLRMDLVVTDGRTVRCAKAG